MEQKALWELFMDTGAPEAFLLYRKATRTPKPEHRRDLP